MRLRLTKSINILTHTFNYLHFKRNPEMCGVCLSDVVFHLADVRFHVVFEEDQAVGPAGGRVGHRGEVHHPV